MQAWSPRAFGRAKVPGQVNDTVERAPRPGVPKGRQPLQHFRAPGDRVKRARHGVILRVQERIGKSLLHGSRRTAFSRPLGCGRTEARPSLRIANETDDRPPERGVRFRLRLVSLLARSKEQAIVTFDDL